MILGAISSMICFVALQLKAKIGYDDSLDCFGIHGVGSGFGVLALAFFLRPSWLEQASATIGHPWTAMDQFWVQCKGFFAAVVLASVMTWIICWIVEKTVGFKMSKEDEMQGLDHTQHGEHGYGMLSI